MSVNGEHGELLGLTMELLLATHAASGLEGNLSRNLKDDLVS